MPNLKVILVVLLSLVLGLTAYFLNVSSISNGFENQPQVSPENDIPNGWKTYTPENNTFEISYPPELEVSSNGEYSILITKKESQPDFGHANFIYVSVIPDSEITAGDGQIYNYNKEQFETLINIEEGEHVSLSQNDNPDLSEWFTYTRLPNVIISGNDFKVFSNSKPWEFPSEITEFRYIGGPIKGNTFILGGYVVDYSGSITYDILQAVLQTFSINS